MRGWECDHGDAAPQQPLAEVVWVAAVAPQATAARAPALGWILAVPGELRISDRLDGKAENQG